MAETRDIYNMAKDVVDAALVELHTCLPAIIDTFDAATQTAKVLPAIQRIKVADGTYLDIPPIINVPVVIIGGGGYSVTFPISRETENYEGDEALLVFCERAIDTWQQSGGVQQPLDRRKHDYTDAVAIIGLRNKGRALSGYSTDSAQLRSDDGEVSVSVKRDPEGDDSITLKVGAFGGATFNSDGSVAFANGATISTLGAFVNGPLAVPGTNVGLGTHLHSAPNTPPTPGT